MGVIDRDKNREKRKKDMVSELQVDITLLLEVNHCKHYVILYLIFYKFIIIFVL